MSEYRTCDDEERRQAERANPLQDTEHNQEVEHPKQNVGLHRGES